MTKSLPKILVVDDELSMREFLEVLLTQTGYDVSLAKSGKQAFRVRISTSKYLLSYPT
ncbi:MAG: hypothetical protein HQK64_13075, partial [Desulfamplus sp.]|nr:hypothetical protein [Desulfamplus sp.]